MNRYFKSGTFARLLGLGLMTVAFVACGPKQHLIQESVEKSQGEKFSTQCNQMDLDEGYAQLTEDRNVGYMLLKFSQNPLEGDDTPLRVTKWGEDLSKSYLVQYRARVLVGGAECILGDYESGVLTQERVAYFKERMGRPPGAPSYGCGLSTQGNFFAKIEFFIKDMGDEWKGLSVFRGTSAQNAQEVVSGLLPPFYLQYTDYARERPQALHRFHPLYLQADKSTVELESLEESYCSLF